MKITVEAIQKTPICCMNRDREGRIKTVKMGGVTRTRISSQCGKRAVREAMNEELGQMSYRTKFLQKLVLDKLLEIEPDKETAETLVAQAFKVLELKSEDAKDVLGFLSDDQAKALAPAIMDNRQDLVILHNNEGKPKEEKQKTEKTPAVLKKEFESVLNSKMTADIALFGRMFAKNQNLSHEAACQFADAFATHASSAQHDFFTAVDDYSTFDEESGAGAGHLDTNEFSTCTLYRYSAIDVDKLAEDIGELTPDAIIAFIRAFATVMPKAKTHTYGNTTLPDFLAVSVTEEGQPINHAGAFEKPVERDIDGGGYAEPSVKRLVNYAEKLYKAYECKPDKTYYINLTDVAIDDAYGEDALCLSELCNAVSNMIEDHLEK